MTNRVQIADVEGVCHVPPGSAVVGLQAGNWMWRSAEAHAQGPVNKPSDMFSFGLVVSRGTSLLCPSLYALSNNEADDSSVFMQSPRG